MSFKQVGKIGRPGKPGKWKQPPGTSFYRFTYNNNMIGGGVNLFRRDEFSPANRQVFSTKTLGNGIFTPENTIVIVENMEADQVTSDWSGTPANPQAVCRIDSTSYMSPGTTEDADTVQESINCDQGNQLKASASLGGLIFKYNDEGLELGPNIRARTYFRDRPTSFVNCFQNYKLSVLILLPNDGITGIPANVGTLTLIKKT